MALNRDELSSKVAKHLGYRKDFVRDVIDSLIDVMVAEIANTGEFKLRGVFSLSSSDVKGFMSPNGPVEPHRRLNVRISNSLKTLFQYVQKTGITVRPDNWITVLEYARRDKVNKINHSDEKEVEVENSLDSFAKAILEED